MKQEIQFTIQSLLSSKDCKVSGPMSPLLFAKEMAGMAGFRFNRLARIWFDDERINQRREDGGLTGYDTLVIGNIYNNDIWLSLWVDLGIGGLPIAMACKSGNGKFTKTPVYKSHHFAKKLSDEETGQVFSFIFSNIEQLNITQE